MLRVLVACEESQAVTKAFRALGHKAFSCDILPCSGGHPEWHMQKDVLPLLKLPIWDLIIAHPPCTDLAVSGARHFARKRADGRMQKSIDFFMNFTDLSCRHVCIENPVCIMSTIYKKSDQIIQPWQFGDEAQKTTCLWLKGLPKLTSTNIVEKGKFVTMGGRKYPAWSHDPVCENGKKMSYNSQEIKKLRSKTFPGIAAAMAEQWSKFIEEDAYVSK